MAESQEAVKEPQTREYTWLIYRGEEMVDPAYRVSFRSKEDDFDEKVVTVAKMLRDLFGPDKYRVWSGEVRL